MLATLISGCCYAQWPINDVLQFGFIQKDRNDEKVKQRGISRLGTHEKREIKNILIILLND